MKSGRRGRPAKAPVQPVRVRPAKEWTTARITLYGVLIAAIPSVAFLLIGVGERMGDPGEPLSVTAFLVLLLVHPIVIFIFAGETFLPGTIGVLATLALSGTVLVAAPNLLARLGGEQGESFVTSDAVAYAALLAHIPVIWLCARSRVRERRKAAGRRSARDHAAEGVGAVLREE
ncbi:hypothetical protein GCM10022221_32770 [Actinocorallia aurea]